MSILMRYEAYGPMSLQSAVEKLLGHPANRMLWASVLRATWLGSSNLCETSEQVERHRLKSRCQRHINMEA